MTGHADVGEPHASSSPVPAARTARQPTRRRAPLLVLHALLIALALLLPLGAVRHAGAAPATFAHFDVNLDLRDDGTFHVTETQNVEFGCCLLRMGHRTIPLARLDEIRNITVTETTDGTPMPYTYDADLVELAGKEHAFTTLQLGSNVAIYWHFPQTSDQTRVFVLAYDVAGALLVYPNESPPNEQIWWTAVGSDLTKETPVQAATMRIHLPRAVNLAETRTASITPDDRHGHSSDGQTFTWQHGPLDSGDHFEVRLQFPPIVDVAPPAWQAADDAQRAQQEANARHKARLNVFFLFAGLALVTGGGVGIYGLWFLRGRDPYAALPADFIPRPPDDLPAGAAGTLLDERADECDVVATLLDLARRQIVTISEKGTPGALGFGAGRDFLLKLDQLPADLSPLDRELLRTLFGYPLKIGTATDLSAAKGRFDAARDAIKEALYAGLVQRGYFTASPQETRRHWRKVGMWGVAVALVVGVIMQLIFGGFAIFPALIVAALCGVLIWLAPSMPRKTRQGAEAAAKWRAFRRYLESIQRYEHVSEAHDIFDQYLAYAVAFGLDQAWVAKFASVDAATPAWYQPAGSGGTGGSWARNWDLDGVPLPHGAPNLPGTGGVKLGVPNLQKTSDRASSGLQSSSNGLLSLLSLAFGIFSAFSGGGKGSSGGGGGGFS